MIVFKHNAARAAMLAAVASLAVPAAQAQPVTGTRAIVYVESNSPDGNAVLAFARDERGRLSPLGTYPTGGKGVYDASLQLGPFDSDQDVWINPERTKLFAVNSGSNTVAIFDIAADGSLTPVAGSPFPSGGTNPVSVGLARDVVAVVNKGMDPAQPPGGANYAAFRLTPDGQMTTRLSTEAIDPAISASQALVSPDARLVFGADFLGGLLRSFLVKPGGALEQTDLQAPPESEGNGSTPALPLGMAAHPRQPVIYVGFVTVNRIGVYTYDATGRLTFVRSVADSGGAPCWIRTNAAGTRMYVSNTADSSISVFDTSDPLNPAEVQRLRLRGSGSAFQIDLDPAETFLYVVTQRATPDTPLGEGNSLHALEVNPSTGRLRQTGHSRYALDVAPAGTRPKGVVAMQPR